MKLLLLSTDGQIFQKASQVRARILEYGKLFEELRVIVYTRPGQKEEIMGNVQLWPTNNRFRVGYFQKAYALARKFIKNSDGWVVSSQDLFETSWVALGIKLMFDIPFQAQVHTDFLSPHFIEASWKNRLRVYFAKRVVRMADHIRVVSGRIRNSLVALDAGLEKKITILPIFVDWEKIRSTSVDFSLAAKYKPLDTFLIMTVARLEPEKNLVLAAEIIRDIRAKHPNVRWLVAGSGSQESVVRGAGAEVVSALGVEALAPYYKIADLFLLASNYEGYGMAAVEAAAAGVPVVMTDVGVALGATFPVGNKRTAVEIIEELIQNPEKRLQLVEGQNGFFKDWPTQEQYLEEYKKSLNF